MAGDQFTGNDKEGWRGGMQRLDVCSVEQSFDQALNIGLDFFFLVGSWSLEAGRAEGTGGITEIFGSSREPDLNCRDV